VISHAAHNEKDKGAKLPSLPLAADHWQAIADALQLSPRQAEIAQLMARGARLKEIASILAIGVPTVRTQQERIYAKIGARGRGDLLLLILDLSHRVGRCGCHQK
jgi:DNA-binding CsgD family transcriptional regulator